MSDSTNIINSLPREGRGGVRVIGIGETVLDIIFSEDQPQKAVPGGSTFNALISLGRVLQHLPEAGRPTVSMITETGDDHIGQIITSFMRENHVSTELVTINRGTQSHLSLAFLDEQHNAQYEFYKDHASARLDPDLLSSSLLSTFTSRDIVLFGSFFAINPVLRDYTRSLFTAAHDAGATLYYDINFRRSHIKDIPATIANLEENMRLSTIVRGSAEDFGYLYGTADPRQVYLEHIRPCCPLFICTDGGGPVSLFAPNSDSPGTFVEAQIPSPHVGHVVSTIGAGDNFNAGIVYALATQGITRQQLQALPCSGAAGGDFLSLIDCALRFSSHVVQRMDNYVDVTFHP